MTSSGGAFALKLALPKRMCVAFKLRHGKHRQVTLLHDFSLLTISLNSASIIAVQPRNELHLIGNVIHIVCGGS